MPLAIDLFCGLGGWTEGLLAEGYTVVGFDIERHQYGDHKYPAQLVIQDVLTLHGSQFRNADLIVASPPCQAYSYRAMPWKKAKALPPPDNSLFESCFRIQAEASAAAGKHIPLVVENVKGAQPWVGRARWHFGSFYLWGNVPALMPIAFKHRKVQEHIGVAVPAGVGKTSWFHGNTKHEDRGGDGTKRPGMGGLDPGNKGFNNWPKDENGAYIMPDGSKIGGSTGIKVGDNNTFRKGNGPSPHFTNPAEARRLDGTKTGGDWFSQEATAQNPMRSVSSRSLARKAASAQIAKIPIDLARHIARVYLPE